MNRPSLPDIGLTYVESLEHPSFAEFGRELSTEGLDFRVESRPEPGMYAGVEWLIPTAVIVLLGRPYFDSFLKEAGKDHYQLLKRMLQKMSARFFGKGTPQGKIVFTKGKAESEAPLYSLASSIVAQVGNDLRVKLLLRSDFDAALCNEAQTAFSTSFPPFSTTLWTKAPSRGWLKQRP